MEFDRYKTIPNALRRHREANGLSQKAVADFLGHKDRAWISRWESGYILPSLVNAARLSLLYDRSVEGLFPGLMNALHAERLGERIGVEKSSQGA